MLRRALRGRLQEQLGERPMSNVATDYEDDIVRESAPLNCPKCEMPAAFCRLGVVNRGRVIILLSVAPEPIIGTDEPATPREESFSGGSVAQFAGPSPVITGVYYCVACGYTANPLRASADTPQFSWSEFP